MTLLASAALRATTTTTTSLGPPRTIDSTEHLVLDWANAITVVTAGQVPGSGGFREQDDVVWDPNGPVPYLFYFSTNDASATYRVTSDDGVEWSPPQACTFQGGPMFGQDPSLVQQFIPGVPPQLHRFGGYMWMYLENNSGHILDLYRSTDGLEWEKAVGSVLPKVPNTWDSVLVGSPVGRHDGSQFILGYEGISGAGVEAHGLAFGTTPGSLTRYAHNPVISAASLGLPGVSAFNDAMWYSADGSRICMTGHSGLNTGVTMYRAWTSNLNPLTWQPSDFVVSGMVDAVRNDLTAFTHQDKLVTAPSDDQSLVLVPLKVP